jgi:FixJ family two-component response regulator
MRAPKPAPWRAFTAEPGDARVSGVIPAAFGLPTGAHSRSGRRGVAMIVYIVEDHVPVAESLAVLLRVEGYRPIHYGTATAFVDEIDGLAPGCILMDVNMPGMDGISALQHLRRRGIGWPVIMMTEDREGWTKDLAWASGALEFLPKPFDGDVLLSVVRAAAGPPVAESL